MPEQPAIVVVGSVNLDIVATAERLPVAGETVTGAELSRFPGGKGANQALAARRLGASVSLVAVLAVGERLVAAVAGEPAALDRPADRRREIGLSFLTAIVFSLNGFFLVFGFAQLGLVEIHQGIADVGITGICPG